MSLADYVQSRIPGARNQIDFVVADHGAGEVIAQWRLSTPAPTASDIAADAPAFRIAQAKGAKLVELKLACRAAIYGGFDSSALGAVHHYEGQEQDQISLIGAALDDADVLYTCIDADGVKAQRLHTAAQMKAAYRDGKAAMLNFKARLYDRLSALAQATTLDAIAAISW